MGFFSTPNGQPNRRHGRLGHTAHPAGYAATLALCGSGYGGYGDGTVVGVAVGFIVSVAVGSSWVGSGVGELPPVQPVKIKMTKRIINFISNNVSLFFIFK